MAKKSSQSPNAEEVATTRTLQRQRLGDDEEREEKRRSLETATQGAIRICDELQKTGGKWSVKGCNDSRYKKVYI